MRNHRENQLNIAALQRLASQHPEKVANHPKYGKLLAKYGEETLRMQLSDCRESQLNIAALQRSASLDPEEAANGSKYGQLLAKYGKERKER